MERVAIVIVAYNSGAEIGGCLDALQKMDALGNLNAEVLVIDNASSDDTAAIAKSKHARVMVNAANAGFAAAVNQGVGETAAPLVLLLNPDAHLQCDLEALTAAFTDPAVGVAGGRLVDREGRIQEGFTVRRLPTPAALALEVLGINRLWPGNPVNWKYRCLDLDLTQPAFVEQPAGAFLMFRREVWQRVGGFDESFWPIWFEDVDFCRRIRAAGYRAKYVPGAVAKHTGAHSIRELTIENRARYWYVSLLKYAVKHYRSHQFRTVCAAVAVGSVFRMAASAVQLERSGFAVYGAVFRLAMGCFLSPRSGTSPGRKL